VHTLGLWDDVYKDVAKQFPDVESHSLLVDAAAMDFVRKPEVFDVVVASNLFGDILTDLSAIITGSVGLGASANINPERVFPSMFEPLHGSAPDIAGKGIANPLAAILSAKLMLHACRDCKGVEGSEGAYAGSRRQGDDEGNGGRGDRGDLNQNPNVEIRNPKQVLRNLPCRVCFGFRYSISDLCCQFFLVRS
jgi:tartrate dehydrogenase/decarboxylase/D-malate dehydrogenase